MLSQRDVVGHNCEEGNTI